MNENSIKYTKVDPKLLIEKLDLMPTLVPVVSYGENIVLPSSIDIGSVDMYFQIVWTDSSTDDIFAYLFITADGKAICYMNEDA